MKTLTKMKAKKMLHEGVVRGHALSEKQKRLFGMVAGGKKPRVIKKRK